MNVEKYKPLFPMAYLILSIGAAVLFKFVGVPDTYGGIIIGAALTRVKIPPVNPKAENEVVAEKKPELNI